MNENRQIRTWFARGRSDVAALFRVTKNTAGTGHSKTIDLKYWRTIEDRLLYALKTFPAVQIQVRGSLAYCQWQLPVNLKLIH